MSDTAGGALPNDPRWPRAGAWLAAGDPGQPCDLAVLGVPTWRTSLSPTGAHATPAAVRTALLRYGTFADEHGVDLASLVAADHGDVDEPDGPEGEQRVRHAAAAAAAASRLLVAIGGDNSATYATALGVWGEGGAPAAGLVTLDAHHDLRDGVSNGSPVRRLVAAGLPGAHVVQVGLLDFANSAEYVARARDLGITVVGRGVLRRRPVADVMAEALDVAGAGRGPVHVDLDVDVCDRSVAPGCPASAPGGISADELRVAAYCAGADPRVRSVDLTEVDATADVRRRAHGAAGRAVPAGGCRRAGVAGLGCGPCEPSRSLGIRSRWTTS